MNKSSILNESPNTILGWPISEKLQVYWCYLIPTLSSCFIYMLYISADIVLTYVHFSANNPHFAVATLFFLYLPAIFCYVFTLTSIELWPKNQDFIYFVGWIVVKTMEHLFFPVWAMYGYAERIFWSIEAVRFEDDEREKCLWNTIKTRPIELYFFFQAYLQAAPQLLLQINILLNTEAYKTNDTLSMQILSIVMSLFTMAKVTMTYQHYESQKLLGRRYPWSRKHGTYLVNEKVYDNVFKKDLFEPKEEEGTFFMPLDPPEIPEIYEEIVEYDHEPKRFDTKALIHLNPAPSTSTEHSSTHSDEGEYMDLPESDKHLLENRAIRSNSFSYTSGNSKNHLENIPEEETTSMGTNYSDENVFPPVSSATAPPNYPAPPRPDVSSASTDISERDLNRPINASTLPKRKFPQQARGQDDVVGKIVLFIIWLCFITSRILSISVFARFFTRLAVYFVLIHFSVILLILIVWTKSRDINRIIQFIFLSYIYIFCIIEFRIKFKYFYRTYFAYFAIVFTENFCLCIIWYLEDWDSWWFHYLFYLILVNSIMTKFFIIVYIKLLKPSKEIVYDVN